MASKLILSTIEGAGGLPVAFPTGLYVGSGAPGSLNAIGTPGAQGFGVGICPGPLPAGMSELFGTRDQGSDNFGNYQYSDGSVMVWVPAFFYKYGTGANGLAVNAVSILPFTAYADVSTANAAGYALHRAFYNGGAIRPGVFVDKFIPSNNGGIASSLRNGVALASAQRGSIVNSAFSSLTGAPPNFYYGALAAAKTRGANFFCSSRCIFGALALLSYAHAAASTTTTYCAWYNATNNFPKGCNNNALGDAQDAAIAYTDDGTATNCGLTGSANFFARTTHNGQNCGIADLNGLVWEVTPGLVTDTAATTYYFLNTAADMKAVTGGNTLATDLWGATGIAALYTALGATYEAATASSTMKSYGNAAQVLSEATSGLPWEWAGLGAPLLGGVGGTNAFGNDGFWDYRPADMCPLSGGYWNYSSSAGVWALPLSSVRGASANNVGFRAALYL